MTDNPLCIAFLWHMHQPYYKDPFTGEYRLPWVRLHGTKDYLDMAGILEGFPEIKQTFNLVPSLLEQLNDYTENNSMDTHLRLSIKKASELDPKDKAFMLENFFLANWDNMIIPFPKFYELLVKRGTRFVKAELAGLARYFSTTDFLDLQVLFNLAWIDPVFRKNDEFLSGLETKGRGYTEEEKMLLIEKQRDILMGIIPMYKKLSDKGQIELSASPYYHPILPLLWDTNSAKTAMPHVTLPKKRFAYPEDAIKQVQMALDFFEKIFNKRPAGMWPSEGSVSEGVVKAMHENGIKWIATDEEILARSIQRGLRDSSGNITDASRLYRPYRFSDVSIIFRDHKISDLIGFVYSGWDAKNAANDLIQKLLHIRASLPKGRPHLVSIILDGENAWEYYKNDAHDFFNYLYEGISNDQRLKSLTVSGFLNQYDSGEVLNSLYAGSWINANFGIWIGHEEDNTAWDYLTDAREELKAYEKENPGKTTEAALKAIYVAEGSDWNWWYGDEHVTETQEEFDELFRLNLMKVYKEIGREIPPHLSIPVLKEDRSVLPSTTIRGFINPKIDGIMTSYYEWYQGAYFDVSKSGGSMHKVESFLSLIYYGFNLNNLFLRIDPKIPFKDFPENTEFLIHVIKPFSFVLNIPLRKGAQAGLFDRNNNQKIRVKDIEEFAIEDILEVSVAFKDIKAKENDDLHIFISVVSGEEELERCPWRGYINLTVPTADFEAMMWY